MLKFNGGAHELKEVGAGSVAVGVLGKSSLPGPSGEASPFLLFFFFFLELFTTLSAPQSS